MKISLVVATACLLLLAASGASTQEPPVIRSRNGIRLVGDSGPRGRLEVSTKDPRFPRQPNCSVAWVPVCDSAATDQMAETMCKLLGYSYGRKYYAPRVNFRTSTSGYTAGSFSCSPKGGAYGDRRLLVGSGAVDDAAALTELPGAGGEDAAAAGRFADLGGGGGAGAGTDAGLRGRARALMSVSRYSVNSPASAPYACAFYYGSCASRGPLAAIECSHSALPPSSPPPPSPPSPPNAPQPYTDSIRLVGGASNRGVVEPNLCPPTAPPEFCSKYGRVELAVQAPGNSGVRLWAPLCAPTEALRAEVARIACQQEYDWPSLRSSSAFTVTSGVPVGPTFSFTIPTGPVTIRGRFNPAGVWVWATMDPAASTASNPRTLQDFGITVSTQPCKAGYLFALSCDIRSSK